MCLLEITVRTHMFENYFQWRTVIIVPLMIFSHIFKSRALLVVVLEVLEGLEVRVSYIILHSVSIWLMAQAAQPGTILCGGP